MKRAAFIDHSFKKVSRSSEFFMDILRREYEVDIYWDDSWKNLPGVDLAEIGSKKYDLVVFFQAIRVTSKDLKKNNIHNVVFVPMYDDAQYVNKEFWVQLKPYKFINFSKKMHDEHKKLGLNSIYVQYFCPPRENISFRKQEKLSGFFWQRYNWINWNHVSSLIKHAPFEKIHIHKAIDPPGYEFYPPDEHEMGRYNISISEWFENHQEYMNVVEKYDVFFVPRRYEGIGMSFIEAMAMGKCVVAPNLPTMNEYIKHGVNGLLYDLEILKPLSFDNISEIAENAYESVKSGYENWKTDQDKILAFCSLTTQYQKAYIKTASLPKFIRNTIMNLIDLRIHINRKYPKTAKKLVKIKNALTLKK